MTPFEAFLLGMYVGATILIIITSTFDSDNHNKDDKKRGEQ